jgi:hypothetical protein
MVQLREIQAQKKETVKAKQIQYLLVIILTMIIGLSIVFLWYARIQSLKAQNATGEARIAALQALYNQNTADSLKTSADSLRLAADQAARKAASDRASANKLIDSSNAALKAAIRQQHFTEAKRLELIADRFFFNGNKKDAVTDYQKALSEIAQYPGDTLYNELKNRIGQCKQ